MRVQVAEGHAVNHGGEQHQAGAVLEVEDRLAAKWLERQLVMPAKEPAKKTPPKKTRESP